MFFFKLKTKKKESTKNIYAKSLIIKKHELIFNYYFHLTSPVFDIDARLSKIVVIQPFFFDQQFSILRKKNVKKNTFCHFKNNKVWHERGSNIFEQTRFWVIKDFIHRVWEISERTKTTFALNRKPNLGKWKKTKVTFFVLFLVKAFVFYCPKRKYKHQNKEKKQKKKVKLGFSSFFYFCRRYDDTNQKNIIS